MSLSEKDVNHVARLARLHLSEDERQTYRQQLDKILDHINILEKYKTKGVPPTSHVIPLSNVWREDEVHPFKDTESILANAPDQDESFFKVEKIIE